MDSASFKRAMGCWASGVAVVTTRVTDRTHGMTVTAFSSVSLDPPLVSICASSKSHTNALIKVARVFAVNILSAGQRELSESFAGRGGAATSSRFEGVAHSSGPLGCPLLDGAVAALECSVVQAVEAGDHVVYIGSVESCSVHDRDPLLYHRNDYAEIVFGRRREPRDE